MEKYLFLILLFISGFVCGQDTDSVIVNIPSVELKTIDGELISTSELKNTGAPMIIFFWKSCCRTPNKMLSVISEEYDDWKEKTGVKIVLVSVDDSRSSNGVRPFINGMGWDYEVLLDENSEFKRAMSVTAIPTLFLFNEKGEMVWKKTSFQEGDEEEIQERLLNLSNK